MSKYLPDCSIGTITYGGETRIVSVGFDVLIVLFLHRFIPNYCIYFGIKIMILFQMLPCGLCFSGTRIDQCFNVSEARIIED